MFKIEVVIRVVNRHGDVVDARGNPAMIPSEHLVVHTYPVSFPTAAAAYLERAGVTSKGPDEGTLIPRPKIVSAGVRPYPE